jgi:hypothetical protein
MSHFGHFTAILASTLTKKINKVALKKRCEVSDRKLEKIHVQAGISDINDACPEDSKK